MANLEVERPFSVLIVDDSAYNLFVLQELIRSIDSAIHVDSALNGQIALDLVMEKVQTMNRRDKFPFEVIILDLNMPVLDGY